MHARWGLFVDTLGRSLSAMENVHPAHPRHWGQVMYDHRLCAGGNERLGRSRAQIGQRPGRHRLVAHFRAGHIVTGNRREIERPLSLLRRQ